MLDNIENRLLNVIINDNPAIILRRVTDNKIYKNYIKNINNIK